MPIRARTLVEEAELALKRGSVASIVQLLQLIRDVNPTPRGLDEAARRRRYALKARLQSLLIRRFGNELRVVPGDEPGVVSILRPQSGADACHAVIVDLDEDARSWVTYQIDTGTIGGANAAATLGSPSTRFNTERTTATQNDEVTRLLAAGQQALAEYDYEQVAIHFQQAQQMSQGAIEPTRVLLEFWIDQMGGDKAALELEPHLPRATLASLEIRALLGVAAARTGDVPRAERLVRGLDGQRVAEVVALIAREALKASDPESAVPWIAQLRGLDPMHPAVRECEHKLQNLRDEARFAAEAHLERLLTSGSLDEAERCANAILQRWPRSEGASRWLRERVAERAGLSAIEALEQAKCEQEAGALRSALVILSNALTPELDQELRSVVQGKRVELERQLQEIADDERVREVGVTLRDILVNLASCSIQEPRADSRLDAYLELPPGLRERVHNQVNRPELAWIEPILTGLGARRARAAAAAVLALVELKPELEQRSTEALVRLQPHVEILEMMPQSAQLIASARDRVRLQRQAMVLEQLHQAEQAMTECNANEAMRVLEAVSLDDLDPKGRERKLGLQSAARFSIEQTDLENRLALLHDQGDFFRAKEIASRLAERTEGDEKLAWIGRHKEIRDEIARTWCWMTGVGEIGDFWMLGVKVRSDNPAPEPWIEPSGVTAMCCITAGPWILLVRRGLESGQVESWVRMVLPRPVENIGIGRITDEVVVLVADDEATLVVSVKDWEIIDYHETSLPGDWRASQCIVSRDARWLWYAQCRKRDKWEFRVQAEEIASRRIARSFDNADLMPVVGSHDAEVGVIGKDRISFHRARGGPESGLTVSATLSAVVQAPSGRGLIGVVEDEHGGNLVLLGPILPGQKPTKLNLKGSSSASHQLAVALKDSLLVVCYYADDGRWLEAFVESNGRPDSLYRARISDEALLITDRGGLCLWVLGLESGKVAARRVVREPQQFLFSGPARRDQGAQLEQDREAETGAPDEHDSARAVLQRLLQDADRFRAEGDPRATIDAARLQELIDSSDEQLLAYTAEWLMQFEADGIGERLSREYVLNILLAQKIDVSSKRSRVDGWGSAFIADMRAYAARLLALNTGPTSATSVAVSPTEEDDPLPE